MSDTISDIKQKIQNAYYSQDYQTVCSLGFLLKKEDYDYLTKLNVGVGLYYRGWKELSKQFMLEAYIESPEEDKSTRAIIVDNLKYF
jgi:hypothetical protein